MKKHKYSEVVDRICFIGEYVVEADEEYGYGPIITLCTLMVNDMDLMLVVDPRVVQEIEGMLLTDHLWNS